MRPRSFLPRCARALFACWFAIVMVQPVTVRACPTEGGVLEQVDPGSHPSGMDHHHMMTKDMMPHEQAPVHDHEKSKCNCIGDCCGSLPTVLPPLASTIPIPARQIVRGPNFPVIEQSFEEPDYLRPPATAPPAPLLASLGA